MLTIGNGSLKALINPKGAELQSIFHMGHSLEYLWDGDPAYWGKHSPILFPIVGTLKEGIYYYRGEAYTLGRHGFARDNIFEVEAEGADRATFLLRDSPGTRVLYPFGFELRIGYQLSENSLTTTYTVYNPADDELFFSIGGHPAFRVPLEPGLEYHDYHLEFERMEQTPRWPISRDGLIERRPLPLLEGTNLLPLNKTLFASDALVLKGPASSAVKLCSSKGGHGLKMDFPGFPYLGLWAAKDADFLCIEPWCGIADGVDSNQELPDKEGINRLAPGGRFERSWTLTLF